MENAQTDASKNRTTDPWKRNELVKWPITWLKSRKNFITKCWDIFHWPRNTLFQLTKFLLTHFPVPLSLAFHFTLHLEIIREYEGNSDPYHLNSSKNSQQPSSYVEHAECSQPFLRVSTEDAIFNSSHRLPVDIKLHRHPKRMTL